MSALEALTVPKVPRVSRILKVFWVLPVSAIGALIGLAFVPFGARACWHRGVLEISLRGSPGPGPARGPRLPFAAITLGHVVLAATPRDQARLRRHERVHVAQFERWGPLLLLAYPAESLFQLVRGRRPYFDNRFEQQARRAEALAVDDPPAET